MSPTGAEMLLLYGGVAAATTALGAAAVRVWRLLRRIETITQQVLGNTDSASGPLLTPLWQWRADLDQIADLVRSELTPNGGTSLKDTVARLDRHQQTIRRDLGQVRRNLDRHLTEHEAR